MFIRFDFNSLHCTLSHDRVRQTAHANVRIRYCDTQYAPPGLPSRMQSNTIWLPLINHRVLNSRRLSVSAPGIGQERFLTQLGIVCASSYPNLKLGTHNCFVQRCQLDQYTLQAGPFPGTPTLSNQSTLQTIGATSEVQICLVALFSLPPYFLPDVSRWATFAPSSRSQQTALRCTRAMATYQEIRGFDHDI